jgi:hypothetical protein
VDSGAGHGRRIPVAAMAGNGSRRGQGADLSVGSRPQTNYQASATKLMLCCSAAVMTGIAQD